MFCSQHFSDRLFQSKSLFVGLSARSYAEASSLATPSLLCSFKILWSMLDSLKLARLCFKNTRIQPGRMGVLLTTSGSAGGWQQLCQQMARQVWHCILGPQSTCIWTVEVVSGPLVAWLTYPTLPHLLWKWTTVYLPASTSSSLQYSSTFKHNMYRL